MKKFRHVRWKRNLRIIPPEILKKLQETPEKAFVVGAVKGVPIMDVQSGVYTHLGIIAANGEDVFQNRVLPEANMGKYSRKNREGWNVIRKDLPMLTLSHTFESPNYGDRSNGTHETTWHYQAYQRDYVDPPEIEMLVTKLRKDAGGGAVFRFAVDIKLDSTAPDFEDVLLFALNLLQENTGRADILCRDATDEELLSTLVLDWEIFPPGTVDEVVQRITKGRHPAGLAQETLIRERISMFSKLGPLKYIQGSGGMNRYIGALFAEDLVVFENVRYGNALYVLHENWTEISRRSRIDLLRSRDVPFERFVHKPGWKEKFSDYMKEEKKRRNLL